MGSGIFGLGGSDTKISATTNNTADSWNKTLTKTAITADSGNTTVNLAPAAGAAAPADWRKYMPAVALACLALAAFLFLTRKSGPPG